MTIIEKVKAALTGVGVGGFHTGMVPPYDRYDLYFNDLDMEVRRSATTAFTMQLGTWHAGSSFSFTPQHKRKFVGGFGDVKWHEFHHYIKAFVTYHQEIQRDFPIMYAFIVWFLIHLEDEKLISFEERFPELDPIWCNRLKTEVLQPNADFNIPHMKHFFRETKLEPFFKDDFWNDEN